MRVARYQEEILENTNERQKIRGLFGNDEAFDFDNRFLPESLANVDGLLFLSEKQKRQLNQIRACGYVYIQGMFKRLTRLFVTDYARNSLSDGDYRVRDGIKYAPDNRIFQQIFRLSYRKIFTGLSGECETFGRSNKVSRTILAHHPLALVIAGLHFEWLAEVHYLMSIDGGGQIDPAFQRLLEFNWLDQKCSRQWDMKMLQVIADNCSNEEMERAIEDYLSITRILDSHLEDQLSMDIGSLSRATNRNFTKTEIRSLKTIQRRALRWTYLGSAMGELDFLVALESLRTGLSAGVIEASSRYQ
jgi:hypothetical protein